MKLFIKPLLLSFLVTSSLACSSNLPTQSREDNRSLERQEDRQKFLKELCLDGVIYHEYYVSGYKKGYYGIAPKINYDTLTYERCARKEGDYLIDESNKEQYNVRALTPSGVVL